MLENLDLWGLSDKFKPVWMGLPRLLTAFMVFPLFSGQILTGVLRNGLLLSLIIIIYPLLEAGYPVENLTPSHWLWLIAKEVFIGMIMAYFISIPFWIVESVGHLIDFQTGSSNAQVFDPISGHESGITAQFLLQMTGAVFFVSGGFLFVLGIFFESYQVWPVYSTIPKLSPNFGAIFIRDTAGMMAMIVKVAAPIIMILVIVEFGLGLVNRFAPQLNVFWLSQPIKGFLAIFILMLFLVHMFESLRTYLIPSRGVLDMLQRALE